MLITERLKAIVKDVVDDGELIDLTAKGLKKTHTALQKAGFSEEQATLIVAHQGMIISNLE